jgi:hypothetical protein
MLSIITASVSAQTNNPISYEVTFKKSGGGFLPDGYYIFTFKLYEKEAGGEAIWRESRTMKTRNGSVLVRLGEINPFDFSTSDNYWLGITIDDMVIPRTVFDFSDKTTKNQILIIDSKQSDKPDLEMQGTKYRNTVSRTKSNRVRMEALNEMMDKKNLYDKNVSFFKAEKENQIEIKKPTFTNFEVVTGYRESEEAISLVGKDIEDVEKCIKRYSFVNSDIRGNIEVKFTVHSEGYVIPESIRIIRSDIRDSRILNCIRKSISGLKNLSSVDSQLGEYTITHKYVF